MGDLTIELAGEEVVLLPERGLYRPNARTLVIADPHFGKAAAFRAGGVPVPETTTRTTLLRLDSALARTGARRLVILGDFLHAKAGRSEALLSAVGDHLRDWGDLAVLLVRGNHDGRAGDPPPEWGIECADGPVRDGPFAWRHEPVASDAGYAVAGHVHPAVALRGRGGLSVTLPCFYFGRDYALLPAFGDFTGAAVIRPRSGERVFVIAGEEVIAV